MMFQKYRVKKGQDEGKEENDEKVKSFEKDPGIGEMGQKNTCN